MRRRETTADSRDRLPFLEGMRGLAALYVVFGHFGSMADPCALAGRQSRAPEWVQRFTSIFGFGHLAVAAFIVLSGFCLQLSLFSRGDGRIARLRPFYLRRARRILPAYYACLAFSILVSLTVTQYQTGMPFAMYLPVNAETVLSHVFLVHNLSPEWMYKLNGVLWSIAIEAQLYVVFPLLVLSLVRFGRFWTLAGAAAIAGLLLGSGPEAVKLYPWYLPLFVLGMVAAHLAYRPHLRRGTAPGLARLLAIVGLGATLWVGASLPSGSGESLVLGDIPLGLAVAAFAYAATVDPRGLALRAFSSRALVALGGFSYSLYLMHHPIQQVVYVARPSWVQGEAPVLIYFGLVGLPIALLGSWLFSLAFERPFLRKPAPSERAFVPLELPLRVAERPPSAATRSARPPSPEAATSRQTA